MELCLDKYNGDKREFKVFPVLNFKKVSENTNIILVVDTELSFTETKKDFNYTNKFYHLYKVQFIGVCEIEIAKNLLVAFYIDENAQMASYIISELPDRYIQSDTQKAFLVDYVGYSDICKITNEQRLSFDDYLEEKKKGSLSANTYFKYEDYYYNADGQTAIMDVIEAE